MLYAILCYHDEAVVGGWTKEFDDAVIAKRHKVTERLAAAGRMGPVARLMPTTAAVSIRGGDPLVLDGPFAETKEQLLGFYMIDCESLEEAIAIASEMKKGEDGGTFEVRPVSIFLPPKLAGGGGKPGDG